VFTATGVKHLHHEAAKFDVGVYFEANGHGTVLFSDRAIERFKTKGKTDKENKALQVLLAMSDLINQSVGDALSDLLMVEAILISEQESFEGWNKAYTDIPSLQQKVKVVGFNVGV
jgi:phosphoacetylglucosamine mutase